jgi:hypothetical protein
MTPPASIVDHPAAASIEPAPRTRGWRNYALWSSLIAPAAVGFLLGRRSRFSGLLAAAGGAAALVALRWQMARWFTDQPGYTVERRIGPLEIRRYPAAVEARTRIDTPDFTRALNRGFERLYAYLIGENQQGEKLHMVAPVMTTGERIGTSGPTSAVARDSAFTMSFPLPPGRLLTELPRPKDSRVELFAHGPRRIAALSFHGRFDRELVSKQARELLARVDEAGLSPQGQVSFAAYDGPSTIPFLRHNEVWVEIHEPV